MVKFMKNKVIQNHQPLLNTWKLFIILLLIFGVFFRFVNIDKKVYWIDETYTSLRISGYKESEFIQAFHEEQVIGIENLLKYQYPNPEKDTVGTFKSIAAEDPHHPPLYYLMLRTWTQYFGTSVASQRSMSAVIGLLVFPSIYWLCRELFQSSLVGWIAIALVAISPFHVLYAQEAREYSLWGVTILLSSAALLRAMRINTKGSWSVYTITLSLAIYCHWFSILVAISHALYVAILERFCLSKTVIAYFMSLLAGALTFAPWLVFIVTNVDPASFKDTSAWVYAQPSFTAFIQSWTISLSRLFVDLDRGWCWGLESSYCRYPLNFHEPLIYLIIPIAILVGYSIYWVFCTSALRIWLFILTLVGVTALALIIPDLILGGQRSSMTRYFTPSILGIQLAVSYCFAAKITSESVRALSQKIWRIIMVSIISIGILSCAMSSQSETWWNKIHNYDTYPISRILNKADNPLLLYRFSNNLKIGTLGNYIMPIAHLLDPKVKIIVMLKSDYIPKIPDKFDNIFTIKPSQKFREIIEQSNQYQMKLVYDSSQDLKPGVNMPTRTVWHINKL